MEQQFESYSAQTKITTYIELCKYFGWRDEEAHKKDCLQWTLISASLKLNCWPQFCELIPICQYAMAYLNLQNLTYRRFTEFQKVTGMIFWIWMRWEHDREDEHEHFSRMNISRAQNSISWAGVITNYAVFSLEHKKNMKSFSYHPKFH